MSIIDGTYRDERFGQGIYNYLNLVFRNPYGTAALMGNLQAESYLTPYRMQSELSEDAWESYDYAESVCNGDVTRTQFIAEGQSGITYKGKYYPGTGFGLAQWTWYERKAALYDWRDTMGYNFFDINCTCTFLIHELETKYQDTFNMILTANEDNFINVVQYVLVHFENPDDQSQEVVMHRYRLAAAILRDYGSVVPPTPYPVDVKHSYPWVLFN